MVPRAGLEPARANAHKILSLACLPIPPSRHKNTSPMHNKHVQQCTIYCILKRAMRTDDPRNITPVMPHRASRPKPDDDFDTKSQESAANIVRDQINQLFAPDDQTQNAQTQPVPTQQSAADPTVAQSDTSNEDNPYEKSQTASTSVQASSWSEYHSAWQNYYQQYYHRYYASQTDQPQASPVQTEQQKTGIVSNIMSDPKAQAIEELRTKLKGKIHESKHKVRRSRHFFPAMAASVVMLLFLFLQYNSVLFGTVQAYISPGNIDPANIIVGAGSNVPVGPESKLIIPKINVEVPIIFDTTPDHDSQMKAMVNGVAWFGIPGANAKPGQLGNTVLSGHSSNDILESGQYKFIFAKLDQLQNGDTFYINYQSKRYTYSVTKKEVVTPQEVSKLVYPTTTPVATLITCTPLGTSLNRLLITANQISPDPASATKSTESNVTADPTQSNDMPGQGPSFLERIFGSR